MDGFGSEQNVSQWLSTSIVSLGLILLCNSLFWQRDFGCPGGRDCIHFPQILTPIGRSWIGNSESGSNYESDLYYTWRQSCGYPRVGDVFDILVVIGVNIKGEKQTVSWCMAKKAIARKIQLKKPPHEGIHGYRRREVVLDVPDELSRTLQVLQSKGLLFLVLKDPHATVLEEQVDCEIDREFLLEVIEETSSFEGNSLNPDLDRELDDGLERIFSQWWKSRRRLDC